MWDGLSMLQWPTLINTINNDQGKCIFIPERDRFNHKSVLQTRATGMEICWLFVAVGYQD